MAKDRRSQPTDTNKLEAWQVQKDTELFRELRRYAASGKYERNPGLGNLGNYIRAEKGFALIHLIGYILSGLPLDAAKRKTIENFKFPPREIWVGNFPKFLDEATKSKHFKRSVYRYADGRLHVLSSHPLGSYERDPASAEYARDHLNECEQIIKNLESSGCIRPADLRRLKLLFQRMTKRYRCIKKRHRVLLNAEKMKARLNRKRK